MDDKKRTIKPLPLIYYALPLLIIILIGIGDAVYLSISHYKNYKDISYHSFCALSNAINCDTVSQSRYSIFLNIPVPIWGVAGYLFYLFIFGAALISSKKNKLWCVQCVLGILFTIYGIILALISNFLIHSYCIMCILSYFVNMLLAFYPWVIFQRFKQHNLLSSLKIDFIYLYKNKRVRFGIIFFGICIITILALFPKYWKYSVNNSNQNIKTGLTSDYSPWIGQDNKPVLIINEYSDYMCFQCRKMHQYLRLLIDQCPEKIMLIHYNYPLDNNFNPMITTKSFHVGAGKLALIAIAAYSEKNFWEINDKLYQISQLRGGYSIISISKITGMKPEKIALALKSQVVKKKLAFDIRKGMKYRITGTPSYVIDGKVYQGTIPGEIINRVFEK